MLKRKKRDINKQKKQKKKKKKKKKKEIKQRSNTLKILDLKFISNKWLAISKTYIKVKIIL